MDISVTIITSIAVALIYVFFIKPRQDKKLAEAKKKQLEANEYSEDTTSKARQNEPTEEKTPSDNNTDAPDLATTNSVVWMAHCINLPFLPQDRNMQINMEFLSLLNKFEKAVKAGDKEKTTLIYYKFHDKMKEKLGSYNMGTDVFKICALSKDLLDLYKMVIEGKRDEDVLSGNGSIRRILKYSIELGSPANTLDDLTDYFVYNTWFDNMPEQDEWLKLALECMMVTGNGELGNTILERLQACGGISDEDKEELLDHAREYRSQTDDSWM